MADDSVESFRGYVTTLRSIAGKGGRELEGLLGFNSGALDGGFYLFALDAPIGIGDFEWKDRTMYSDGWHFDRTIGEYVQRQDELRAHLGKLHSYNERRVDDKIDEVMRRQLLRLNVRHGADRIVKVIPKTRVTSFPDSPSRYVPQWRLRVVKSFVRLADVAPGGVVAD